MGAFQPIGMHRIPSMDTENYQVIELSTPERQSRNVFKCKPFIMDWIKLESQNLKDRN